MTRFEGNLNTESAWLTWGRVKEKSSRPQALDLCLPAVDALPRGEGV